VGRRGKHKARRKLRDARRGASRETQGAGWSRDARRRRVAARFVGRGAGRKGSRFPRRMSRPPGVSGGERRRRGERDVRRYRSTLHRRARSRRGGGFERRGRSTLHRRTLSRQERGWREEVAILVAEMGTLLSEGLGEERDESGERRYPSTLHRRVPSSHQESRERRLSPRKRLKKTGSCNSLNSRKESIPTQSPPSAARKTLSGRARVCRRGARGWESPANYSRWSSGRRAARVCASPRPYLGPEREKDR
jgi:hypothetical protein